MYSQGPFYAGATAQGLGNYGTLWGQEGNAIGPPDGIYAIGSTGAYSTGLLVTDFGFTLNPHAIIRSITAAVFGHSRPDSGNVYVALELSGEQAGVSTFGNAFGPTDAWTPDVPLWPDQGVPTAAQVNSTDFGFTILNIGLAEDAYVDAVRMTVFYDVEFDVSGGPDSAALIYGRSRIQFRDRRGKTVMRTSRRRPSCEIVAPLVLPREAA